MIGLDCEVWLLVMYVIVNIGVHKILAFSTCPQDSNAL